jgi:hypothetical protein
MNIFYKKLLNEYYSALHIYNFHTSNINFGEKNATIFINTAPTMLAPMHAAYLMVCARKGVPLARWGIRLTVLLKKLVGFNFVHKLWATCLLEKDFDWIKKVIFAKWMIGLALENNLIPGK